MSASNYLHKFKQQINIISVVIFALLVSKMILAGKERYAFILCFIPLFIFLYKKYLSQKKIIILLIISVFFPIPLNISSTNLGPTSQYFISFVFFMFLADCIIKRRFYFNQNLLLMLLLLLFSGGVSTLLISDHDIFRTSFWALVLVASGGMFLLFTDALKFNDFTEKKEFFLKLIDFILLLLSIQIVIGIVVFFFPGTEKYLYIFYSKNVDISEVEFYTRTLEINASRIRTPLLSPEGLGEYIAVLFPFLIYRLTNKFSLFYLACSFIICIGLIMCATRSGIVLSLFGILCYVFIIEKSFKRKTITFMVISLIVFVIFYFQIGTNVITERFMEAYYSYSTGQDFLEVSNRSFFVSNFKYFLETLSFFGNGLVSPIIYGVIFVDFHNLFMTIFFRYGIIGGIIYFILPISLILQLLKKIKKFPEEKLYSVILLSILIFFINECKFEFTRKNNYVLLIWITFSFFYLLVKDNFPKKEVKE
ncbi:MAG: hypothetical protein RBR08_07950 [Desulforegulaceae bacterium]|nr:hypothetical protein [Desulforegulaceae bacterium]